MGQPLKAVGTDDFYETVLGWNTTKSRAGGFVRNTEIDTES